MKYRFEPFLSLPTDSRENPFFISTSKGGLSHCIVRGSGGYTLPNCVALVHAEVLETVSNAVSQAKAIEIESKLCRNDASIYWGYKDEFERGQTPRLGAIACWKGGAKGKGHVAFVTSVDGLDWQGKASNYSGSAFYSCAYNYSPTYKYRLGASYTFQGFIYLPYDFSIYATESVGRSSAREQVKVNIDNLNVRAKASTSAVRLGYAEPGYYNVISETSDSKYKWYQIESGKWVANPINNGTWVSYYPKEEPHMYEVTFLVSSGDVKGLEEYGKTIAVTPTVKMVK